MYHDHHLHPLGYVSLVMGLELMDAPDIETVLTRTSQYADIHAGPVIGQRLNDEHVAEARLPIAKDIDGFISDRPVLLYRYCGHIAVANSKALQLAGVDEDSVDPEGGGIDRDPSGKPTGVLREAAVQLVSKALATMIQPPTDQEILAALASLPAMGIGSITGIISVGEPVWCGVGNELDTLIRLADQLPIDIDVLVVASNQSDLRDAAQQIQHSEGHLRFHGWKEFADGSLGGHTAAMYEPFFDKPETRGMTRLNVAQAIEMGQASLDLGGVVAIHAIGDRANDTVLGVHSCLIDNGADPSRLRIEHASILKERTIERMGQLGVTASIQPAFLASEENWLEKRLGADRMKDAYPFKSLSDAGVPLLGGSDSPVELPDPEVGINAAIDRHGINVDQSLDRDAAEALFRPGKPYR